MYEAQRSAAGNIPMTAATKIQPVSIEAYLEAEKHSPVKHEYVDGHIYAMTGTSKVHNLIVGNLASLLRIHLRGGPCRVYTSDVKVMAGTRCYYPDVVVSCERSEDPYIETLPRLIIEVLSDSTERTDREEKRPAYQTLATLQEYVLVSQDSMVVQVYRRASDAWVLEDYGQGDRLAPLSVALTLAVEQIYEDVWN